MTVLVLGPYGAVGGHVVDQLRRSGDQAITAGRDPARAERVIDLTEPELNSYRAALTQVDTVVNASGAEDPRLAEVAGHRGCAFVDITATIDYISQLEQLDVRAPVLINVGLAPGLTNLLAAALHHVEPGPIDLGVLLGAGEHHGAGATDWSYRMLGRTFHDGERRIRNYSHSTVFDVPGSGRRRLYRLDFSDQYGLSRDLAVRVHTYFGLDSRTATAALALGTWIPGAAAALRRADLALPGTDHWTVLARARNGAAVCAHGRGQSHATAVMAASAARTAPTLPAGVHSSHQVLTLSDIPTDQGISVCRPQRRAHRTSENESE